MSRNFDILRRAGVEEELFPRSSTDSAPDECTVRALNGHEEVVKPAKSELLFQDTSAASPSRNGRIRKFANNDLAQEEVVKLVQRVFVLPNASAPRVVVFSNIDKGSGSSELCFRSGEVLSLQSASVCLVDANLRGQGLQRLFGSESYPGLLDAMATAEPIKNFAVPIADGNIWLVPPGAATDGQGLVASDRLRSIMAELKEEFDYVLIDAPPVNSYADTVLLGQMADGVILVVEANSTRRETALMAKKNLQDAQVNLLGAILNNRTFPIPEALYRKF